MFESEKNIAIYCPITQEIITPAGDFIPLPKTLARMSVGSMTQAKARIIKRWAVRGKHLDKDCSLAMFS